MHASITAKPQSPAGVRPPQTPPKAAPTAASQAVTPAASTGGDTPTIADAPASAKQGKAVPALADALVAAWDTERADPTEYRDTLLPEVHLDLEEVAGSWDGFPDFLKRLKALQDESGDARPVTLILNVHGNNGTGLKMVSYRRETAEGEPTDGTPTHEDASIASAAQINAWLKEAGFDPAEVTIISEVCNAGPGYLATVDGFNATEKAAALAQAKKLAGREGLTLGEVTFLDPKGAKADFTYHWIGRKNGGNAAGTVFLQAATGMGTTGVSGQVAAAPIVDLNKLGKPGAGRIAITGERNPWPNDHFNAMIDALRQQTPRFFETPAAAPTDAGPAD